jgi:hypothetical protein
MATKLKKNYKTLKIDMERSIFNRKDATRHTWREVIVAGIGAIEMKLGSTRVAVLNGGKQ